MVQKYGSYQILKENEIRVLRVPTSNQSSWQIMHLDLRTKPKYCALSYTWGDDNPSFQMVIDDKIVNIRRNLHEALFHLTRRLQSGQGVSSTKYFWVDAICINQDDKKERRDQVRLMRLIYERAHDIVVWLGKPRHPENANHFFQLVTQLEGVSKKAQKLANPYRPWWMPKPPPVNDTDIFWQLLGPLYANKIIWNRPGSVQFAAWQSLFFDILQSPWWLRTWVYQEATVPENLRQIGMNGVGYLKNESKVKYAFGFLMTSWVPLLKALLVGSQLINDPRVVQELRHCASETGDQPLEQAKRNLAAFEKQRILKRLRKARPSFELLDILQIFRPSHCKDPRDKVYAPLGLTSASSIANIVPDYSDGNTKLKTYLDVVKIQMGFPGHELDFLGYVKAAYNLEVDDWPTWLPDWSESVDVKPLPKVLHRQKDPRRNLILPYDRRTFNDDRTKAVAPVYNASLGAQPQAAILGPRLALRGFICARIAVTVDNSAANPRSEEVGTNTYAHELRMLEQAGATFAVGSTEEARMASLAPMLRVAVARAEYNSLGQVVSNCASFDGILAKKQASQRSAEERSTMVLMMYAVSLALRGRIFCRTRDIRDGRVRIGLVPETARAGDLVYVFLGGQVLYVVRPRRNSEDLGFLGECFVDGLMDGEAFNVGGVESMAHASDVCLR